MTVRFSRQQMLELFRYYQAGVVNTLFGISVYSILVFAGMNMFLAQCISQILGIAFNYITYSHHVFRESQSNKAVFFLSYVVNYLASVSILFVASRFVRSPYVAGLIATFVVSVLNYFVLKHLVFRRKAA